MPPKAEKESLLLLINVGVTSPGRSNDPALLEKAKHIAERKIEKMIFLRSKDEVAIMVMGSSNTKNNLKTEHVEEFADFQVPNWDLVKKVTNLQGTNYCSNWVEALVAAVEFMKKNIYDASTKRIILISDFNEEADIISQFEADEIAKQLLTEGIKLITVGEDTLDERAENDLKVSEVFLKDLHEKINGQHITFDTAISDLRYFYTEGRKNPCYFNLEFIDKIIPIASYVKIDTSKFPTWMKAKDDERVKSKTQYVDRQRDVYTKDDIVPGYKYGEIYIPVEKEQEEAMNYKSGPKSYKIHSFTHKDNINLEYLYGSSTHVIFPSNKVPETAKVFYSLVQAMHNTNTVAIVRRVNRENFAPKMSALFPCVDVPDEPWCLVEVPLIFSEDRRVMKARPIKAAVKQLTDEQEEVLDKLIGSLKLPDITDDCEVDGIQYFLPGCLPDPAVQHRWHVLAHRALNSNKPLPPMENYLKEVFDAPLVKKENKERSLKEIAELFQLESADSKTDEKKEESVQKDDEVDIKEEDKIKSENDPFKKLYTSKDTSDVDLDTLAANI